MSEEGVRSGGRGSNRWREGKDITHVSGTHVRTRSSTRSECFDAHRLPVKTTDDGSESGDDGGGSPLKVIASLPLSCDSGTCTSSNFGNWLQREPLGRKTGTQELKR